jgi:hypothetical protein
MVTVTHLQGVDDEISGRRHYLLTYNVDVCAMSSAVLCRSEADIWLNDPEVRQVLHAAPPSLTGPWQICSDRIFYTANGGSMLPVHNFLVREAGGCCRQVATDAHGVESWAEGAVPL